MLGAAVTADVSQLAAISRLFSSAVIRDLGKRGRSSLFARLVAEARIEERCGADATVGDAFDSAFSVLRRVGQRDEYVYRAALIRNILLGKHSLNTASALSEFRAGACKADLVILNGTATVYEIKSERDSLARLEKQIHNYQLIFAKTYVIAGERHVESVLNSTSQDVGVMCLSRRHQISVVRHASNRSDSVCPQTIFDSLRISEARAILSELGGKAPDLPNTQLYSAMREIFGQLCPVEVHRAMVKILKKTRNLAPLGELVGRLPKSLHAAALSMDIPRADQDRLAYAVQVPLRAAVGWA